MNGVILIDKPDGYTSRDIVNIVGKELGTKKVGHTGTLDPMATGVLAICVNDATKLVETLMCDGKVYEAEITLGLDTDTLDSTGNILKEVKAIVFKEEIEKVLNNMIGTYNQEVPKYSAVKVNGKKLYEYARNGEDVVLPKHEVTIYSLELIDDVNYSDNNTIFKIKTHVSKGTYIRSLIRDIASKLNTIGVMSSLRRIKQGHFLIEDCVSLEKFKLGNYKLLSIEEILKDEFTVEVDDFVANMISNGRVLENRYNREQVVFKNKEGKVLAIYKTKEDKDKLYVFKMFH